MATLSSDQLTSIAQEFHDLANSVGQFRLDRIHEGAALTDPGIVQLLGLQFSLLNTSSSFALQAAEVRLADADRVALLVTEATNQANDAIETATTINKVVNVASAAGVLAAAFMTGDLGQVFSAAAGVKNAIGA
jgi:hypothetical protein